MVVFNGLLNVKKLNIFACKGCKKLSQLRALKLFLPNPEKTTTRRGSFFIAYAGLRI